MICVEFILPNLTNFHARVWFLWLTNMLLGVISGVYCQFQMMVSARSKVQVRLESLWGVPNMALVLATTMQRQRLSKDPKSYKFRKPVIKGIQNATFCDLLAMWDLVFSNGFMMSVDTTNVGYQRQQGSKHCLSNTLAYCCGSFWMVWTLLSNIRYSLEEKASTSSMLWI